MQSKNSKIERFILISIGVIVISLCVYSCKEKTEPGCDGDGVCELQFGEDSTNCADCRF